MMTTVMVILATTLGIGCAGSGSRAWRKSDIALESVFAVALAADWDGSGRFVSSCHEANPVIGACGQRIPLNLYIPLSALLHVAITHLIPSGTWRTAWLGLTAGIEADAAYSNTLITLPSQNPRPASRHR
jgi:hypothetical protein